MFALALLWSVVAGIECLFLHVRYRGSMKRGVRIWSEVLPSDMKLFLRRLSSDVRDAKTGGFIRKKMHTALIRAVHTKIWLRGELRGGALPYVAYVDLAVREPRIGYRIPYSSFLFLAAWCGVGIWMTYHSFGALSVLALGVLAMYWNHRNQREWILKFIREQM
jgi:hypothetical protein